MNLRLLPRRCGIRLATLLGAWAMTMALPAQASLSSLASPGASISLSGSAKNGSFLDVYFFSLGQTLGLSHSVSYGNRAGLGLVSNFSASLFSAGGSTPLVAGIDSAPGSNLTNNQFYAPALAAGAYRLEISGIGSGVLGGGYTGSLTALQAPALLLAIPEPESWLMMFLGVAMISIRMRQIKMRSANHALAPLRSQHHA